MSLHCKLVFKLYLRAQYILNECILIFLPSGMNIISSPHQIFRTTRMECPMISVRHSPAPKEVDERCPTPVTRDHNFIWEFPARIKGHKREPFAFILTMQSTPIQVQLRAAVLYNTVVCGCMETDNVIFFPIKYFHQCYVCLNIK